MTEQVLIIDDDEALGRTLSRRFEQKGFHTLKASTSEEALMMAAQQPGYILLDMKIGQDSGLQLLPSLLELSPRSKIVVLTGYGSIATAVSAIKAGAHHYLTKPAGFAEILAAFELNPESDTITPTPETPSETVPEDASAIPQPERMSIGQLEWEHIQKVLAEHNGNISATARALGMHRRTLQRKLAKKPRF